MTRATEEKTDLDRKDSQSPEDSKWVDGARGIYSDHSRESKPGQKNTLDAYDLCYDCDTGYHYIK